MADLSKKMKDDWDRRAKENSIKWVRPSADINEFDRSGKDDVTKLLSGLEHLPFQKMMLLNIGCGIGRLEPYFASRFLEVHGIDVSGEMIRIGRQRLANFQNVFLHVGNGVDLSLFCREEFDMVVSHSVFQHLPRVATYSYFREAFRVLKKGGILRFQITSLRVPAFLFTLLLKVRHFSISISAEPDLNDTFKIRYYDQKGLETILRKIGFTQINMLDFTQINMLEKPRKILEKYLWVHAKKPSVMADYSPGGLKR